MTLHIVYRASPGVNTKRRPGWFSKWLCIASLIESAERHESMPAFCFIVDGRIGDEVGRLMDMYGEIIQLDNAGNSGSFLAALRYGTAPDVCGSNGIFLVEDDYLHSASTVAVVDTALTVPGTIGKYLAPYDHPDRYSREDDLVSSRTQVITDGGWHWQRVESTTMTFATDVQTLRADRYFHRAAARFTSYPHDRALWRSLQGLGWRAPIRRVRTPRRLFGAIPSLATHCESGLLAPVVRWEDRVADVRAWLTVRGLPTEVGW